MYLYILHYLLKVERSLLWSPRLYLFGKKKKYCIVKKKLESNEVTWLP